MAKSEIKTDFLGNDLLNEAHLNITPQGSDIKEIEMLIKLLLNHRQENQVLYSSRVEYFAVTSINLGSY